MDPEIIVKKCRRETIERLRANRSSQALVYSVIAFHQGTDDLILQRKRMEPDLHFDCKVGCHHCCKLRVEALPPEIFRVARHIRALPEYKQRSILAKLEDSSYYAEGKTYVEYHRACSFLSEDGACDIYAIRPHKCRQYLSMDVRSCEATRTAVEDQTLRVQQNALVHAVVPAYKSRGVVMHPAELAQATLHAMKNPELEANWASGDDVFERLPEGISI